MIQKSFITIIMLSFVSLMVFSQNTNIAVESFSISENDQEARVISPRKDQNNRVSAIIKLETPLPLQNFTFESGSIGIVATRQEKGEIWIYMPVGAQRLTIKHGQLGVVRDYPFGELLREATVYIMKLKSGNVKTIVEDDVNLQYFVVNCSIDGATIKIDEGDPESFSTGKFQKLLSYGKHKYIIEAPLYHPLVGNIEITTSKSELTPEMKPMFGTLTLNTQPEQGADIFIDGEKRGQTPLTINRMKSGEYSIQVVKNLFLPATEKTTVTDGRNHNLNITLKPNFAVITLNGLGDIYVNDAQKGNGKWTGKLTPGTYKVEVMKTSHRPSVTSIIVKAGEDKTIDLQTPTPVYGSLDIKSNIDAVVFIDGEKQQETTPAIIKKVLIGKHEIKLQANGYEPYTQTIEVVEGKLFAMNSTLQKKGNSISNIPAATMKDDYDMVFVSSGTFTMGCTSEQGSDCLGNEKPAHQVTLSSFYIGKYEVTQKQWKDIMGSNPSYFKGDNLPVEQVSWDDVQKFIRKLNAKTGKNYRLPTEVEWEYAARGGSQSQGYKYSGSNNVGIVAWYSGNSDNKTHPIGTKRANELGIYDMSGSVWEWCFDWYGSYQSSSQTNPKDASASLGSYRVLRGGGWLNGATSCRVSYRGNSTPSYRGRYFGFRVALSL